MPNPIASGRQPLTRQSPLHPLTEAYYDGCEAFHAGAAEPAKGNTEFQKEFRRGYVVARKRARFNATIEARLAELNVATPRRALGIKEA